MDRSGKRKVSNVDKINKQILKIEDLLLHLKQDIVKKSYEIINTVENQLKNSIDHINSSLKKINHLKTATVQNISEMLNQPEYKDLFLISKFEDILIFDIQNILMNIESNFFLKEYMKSEYIICLQGENEGPSMTLNYIDLIDYSITGSKRKIKFENHKHTEKIFSSSTLVVQLYDSNFFILGGEKLSYGIANTFNIENLTFDPQTRCEAIHSCGGCYFKEQIFVFGGLYGTNFANESKKYNFIEKTWKKIQPLCENFSKTTATVVNDLIFLTGTISYSAYMYSDRCNNYKSICKGKFIQVLIGNFAIGMYENSFALFELKKDNLVLENIKVDLVEKINYEIAYLNTCSSVRYGRFIYFISDSFDLFRIDVESRKLEKVKNLKFSRSNTNRSQ